MPEKERYDVYHVQDTGSDKSAWTKIGVAFANQDGSLNVLVNFLPVKVFKDGVLTLNVRKAKTKNGQAKSDDDDF